MLTKLPDRSVLLAKKGEEPVALHLGNNDFHLHILKMIIFMFISEQVLSQ